MPVNTPENTSNKQPQQGTSQLLSNGIYEIFFTSYKKVLSTVNTKFKQGFKPLTVPCLVGKSRLVPRN
jgi:heme-binding NEAT domain protein